MNSSAKPRKRRIIRWVGLTLSAVLLAVISVVVLFFVSLRDDESYNPERAKKAISELAATTSEPMATDRTISEGTLPEQIPSSPEVPTPGYMSDSVTGSLLVPGPWPRITHHTTPTASVIPETFQTDAVNISNFEQSDTGTVPSSLLAGLFPEEGILAQATTTTTAATTVTIQPVSSPDYIPHTRSPELPDEMFDTIMLIGEDKGGYRADSIMLLLFPQDSTPPALVSIPRDLYLYNSCSQRNRRINASLGGCKSVATGPEMLALTVMEFTGIKADNYIRIGFEGFTDLVDAFGGVEICVEYPTRDIKAGLDIKEAGCQLSDGATVLAYSRSRNAKHNIGGEWKRAWDNDSIRQQHQREVLISLAGRMKQWSFAGLLSSLQAVSHAFRINREWSILEAVSWVWSYKDVDVTQITQLKIPIKDYVTSGGAQVVLPTRSFNPILAEWYPPAKR